jgi:1-deoxy-D-xylulose-5-phosphate synthase
VILNDNEMSIAPPVGAMSRYLSGLYANRRRWRALKDIAEGVEARCPAPCAKAPSARASWSPGIPLGGTLFEELGFSYVGPIDGHDMDQLLPVLRAAGPATGRC